MAILWCGWEMHHCRSVCFESPVRYDLCVTPRSSPVEVTPWRFTWLHGFLITCFCSCGAFPFFPRHGSRDGMLVFRGLRLHHSLHTHSVISILTVAFSSALSWLLLSGCCFNLCSHLCSLSIASAFCCLYSLPALSALTFPNLSVLVSPRCLHISYTRFHILSLKVTSCSHCSL